MVYEPLSPESALPSKRPSEYVLTATRGTPSLSGVRTCPMSEMTGVCDIAGAAAMNNSAAMRGRMRDLLDPPSLPV